MQCRKALEEASGDMEKALFFLRKASAEIAEKKADRALKAGLVQAYVHTSGVMGALVELNCETDFVAKNPEFKTLAYDLAMHVTATAPQYLDLKEIPAEETERVKALMKEEVESQAADKPEAAKEKMIEGKVAGYFRDKTLLEQSFIKDSNLTISQLLKTFTQKFGENIGIGSFKRISVLGN